MEINAVPPLSQTAVRLIAYVHSSVIKISQKVQVRLTFAQMSRFREVKINFYLALSVYLNSLDMSLFTVTL